METRYRRGSIEAALRRACMTVDDAAAIAGFDPGVIFRMCAGDVYAPSWRERVASALGVSPDALWDSPKLEPRPSAIASRLVEDDSDDVWEPATATKQSGTRADASQAIDYAAEVLKRIG